ncbi:MAG TPA: hypothetical protein VMQ52_04020 [Candidatus Saccharimonadales bacterium]|nr:hypothetical protein [Candidatus Saccharimonadales bacterium]
MIEREMEIRAEPWPMLILEPIPTENFKIIDMAIPFLEDSAAEAKFQVEVLERVVKACGAKTCLANINCCSSGIIRGVYTRMIQGAKLDAGMKSAL